MDDVQRRLKPGGMFVMYNYFRQGWIVSRLQNSVRAAFGADALVLNLPSRDTLDPDENLGGGFTDVHCGRERSGSATRSRATPSTGSIPRRRSTGTRRTASPRNPPTARSANAMAAVPPDPRQCGRRAASPGDRRLADAVSARADDSGGEPSRRGDHGHHRGAAAGAVPAARGVERAGDGTGALVQMFFLGAGFMLVETKAVVHMALLFGGTWIVNSVVIFAVLVMIVLANWFVAVAKPSRLAPYYAGLLISLAVSALVPMESFLGMNRAGADRGGVSARVHADPVCRRGVCGVVLAGRSNPIARSASTSPARCSAGWRNTAR